MTFQTKNGLQLNIQKVNEYIKFSIDSINTVYIIPYSEKSKLLDGFLNIYKSKCFRDTSKSFIRNIYNYKLYVYEPPAFEHKYIYNGTVPIRVGSKATSSELRSEIRIQMKCKNGKIVEVALYNEYDEKQNEIISIIRNL